MMQILLVSDEESPFIWDHWNPEPFRDIECIISCGDLKRGYLDFLCTMTNVPLFYVPGNHDKDFEASPPEGCEPLDGNVVTFKTLRIAGLGGCKSQNRKAKMEYTEREMTRKVAKLKRKIKRTGGIDLLVTHAPALGQGDGDDHFHRGFACFLDLLDTFQPRFHVYGHQHKCYGRVSPSLIYGNTTLINACGYQILEL